MTWLVNPIDWFLTEVGILPCTAVICDLVPVTCPCTAGTTELLCLCIAGQGNKTIHPPDISTKVEF